MHICMCTYVIVDNVLVSYYFFQGFPFLFQHIRDGINIRQTCNLIFSLCRYNNRLAEHVSIRNYSYLLKILSNKCNGVIFIILTE